MSVLRRALSISAVSVMLMTVACGGNKTTPPTGPTPPDQPTVTANVYILPNAVTLKNWAFSDEDIVIFKGERMHWVNLDTLTHHLVADSPNATDFQGTTDLPSNGEQSFVMNKIGRTTIHCTIHPEMTGTLVVREH